MWKLAPAVLVLGCAPAVPTAPARVWDVDAATLHRARQSRAGYWDGQRVRVRLAAHSYTVSGAEVRWHAGDGSGPPDVVFLTDAPPPDHTVHLLLVGTCRPGPVGPVVVADCACSVTPP